MDSFDIRNDEFALLTADQQNLVRAAVSIVRASRERVSQRLDDDSEVYAYPGADGKTHWGLNVPPHDRNIARGVLESGEQL